MRVGKKKRERNRVTRDSIFYAVTHFPFVRHVISRNCSEQRRRGIIGLWSNLFCVRTIKSRYYFL